VVAPDDGLLLFT